jgi:hypothetical protein
MRPLEFRDDGTTDAFSVRRGWNLGMLKAENPRWHGEDEKYLETNQISHGIRIELLTGFSSL